MKENKPLLVLLIYYSHNLEHFSRFLERKGFFLQVKCWIARLAPELACDARSFRPSVFFRHGRRGESAEKGQHDLLRWSNWICSAHDQGIRWRLQGKRRSSPCVNPSEAVTRRRCVTVVSDDLVTGHGARREELLSRHTETNQEESGTVQALSPGGARRLRRVSAGTDVTLNRSLASRRES